MVLVRFRMYDGTRSEMSIDVEDQLDTEEARPIAAVRDSLRAKIEVVVMVARHAVGLRRVGLDGKTSHLILSQNVGARLLCTDSTNAECTYATLTSLDMPEDITIRFDL